jgi:hypothetical protein
MSAKPAETDDDRDAIEWELIALVEEHGSERQALALLHDFHALLADAEKAVSRGFLRGVFLRGRQGAARCRGSVMVQRSLVSLVVMAMPSPSVMTVMLSRLM